jgi:hypothetical protein
LLESGLVLVAGANPAEIYNPTSGTFTTTGNLNDFRTYQTSNLLGDGTVLIAGGNVSFSPTSIAELYSPSTGTFSLTGSLNNARKYASGNLLNGTNVLVVGGVSGTYGPPVTTAELYVPSSREFLLTGTPLVARGSGFTSTLLTNGTVLVAGGASGSQLLSSAELYNPSGGIFSSTGGLNTVRSGQTATLLGNGLVLVAGGSCGNGNYLASAELYDPVSSTPPGLLSINVFPLSPYLAVGKFLNLAATGVFSGSDETLVSVTWSSSNPAVATVTNDASNRGNAYGVGYGTTKITACAGSICGSTVLTVYKLTDGSDFATGDSTVISTSLTPTLSNDFAVVVLGTQNTIGQSSPIVPPGYTSISADGNTTIAYRQLTSTATESPSDLINSADWAEGLVLLATKSGTSAAFRSKHEVSGAVSAPTQTLTPTTPYLTGSTVFVCLRASDINTSGGAPTIISITDNQSNAYVKLGAVAIGGGPGGAPGAAVEIWAAPNVVGGTPTITVNIAGGGGWSGTLGSYEFTGVI